MKYLAVLVLSLTFLGCAKEVTDSEKGALKFESYISTLIAARDTLEFTGNFILNMDENTANNIKEMYVIYNLTTKDIVNSIRNKGSLYRRIFSDDNNSLSSYLPKEGGFYDVTTTYRKYKGTSIVQIEYSVFNKSSENSIEIVGIYLDGKWHLLTINFLDL